MRGIVRAAKVRVIHKLCREIKKLKVKKYVFFVNCHFIVSSFNYFSLFCLFSV